MATLSRQLGLASATAIVVGEVIAVGIFLTPAGMAKTLASPAWLLGVWLVMAFLAICGALCYGELASRFPEAGGGYVYLREAYGSALAYLYGWKCFLVMDPGITAALAVGLAGYVQYVTGIPPIGAKVVAVSSILVLAAINVVGLRFGAGVTRLLMFLKVGSLLGIALWGFGAGLGDWSNFMPFATRPSGAEPIGGALAAALISAFFSYGGWWDLSKLAGEVREPSRTLPRALAFGILIVAAVYILTSAVFYYLVPVTEVTDGETFAAQAGERLFGPSGGVVFALIVIVSVLGSLAAVMMVAPRVYFAMARDGLFPRGMAQVHERFGTPARAIALQAILASVLAAVSNFDQIIAFFIFVTLIFIGLTVGAVFVVRRRPDAPPGYETLGYPVTPILFLLMIVVLEVMLAMSRPLQAALGVLVVLLGLPFYWLIRRMSREPVMAETRD
jgi:basic amino acid/polyamine antiporter, APA family